MSDFINFTATEFSAAVIIFNIFLSFALAMIITWVYRKTHRGLSYSQSFIFTMVIICIMGAVVMMVVRNNIVGAFALLGAFSLIRFRTILKETKDIAYIFFALAMGVAVGTNNYLIAVIATVFVCTIILILTRYNFGSVVKEGALVTLLANDELKLDDYKNLFKNYLDSYSLLQIKSLSQSKEYSFSVKIKNDQSADRFIQDFQRLQGVESVEFIVSKNAIEY